MFVEVALPLPIYVTYTYQLPERLINSAAVGKRVLIPVKGRKITGYILSLKENFNLDDNKSLEYVIDFLDNQPLFLESMIPFFRWLAAYYLYPIGYVIRESLPGGLNVHEIKEVSITDIGKELSDKNAIIKTEEQDQYQILEKLNRKKMPFKQLAKEYYGNNSFDSLIKEMVGKNWITISKTLTKQSTRFKTERYVQIANVENPDQKTNDLQKEIIDTVTKHCEISLNQLKEISPKATASINSLVKKGYLTFVEKKVYRDPFGENIEQDKGCPVLTSEQKNAVNSLVDNLGSFKTFLLFGVTGSGKTEVYLRVTQACLEQNKTVIILVPEIALISQMERLFRARFGECVAVLHSGLSGGERFDQWIRIINNEVPIVIGARSAIFAPLRNIGLIIVDEEHDTSYKQENNLRYNARDIAVMRGKMENCSVLLGSATPSFRTYYNVMQGKYSQLNLTKRIYGRALPLVQIINLKDFQGIRGFRRFITDPLIQAIQETLNAGEQVLLFLNRRGFASLPVCANCNEPLQCEHCAITLTFHKNQNAYRCHYCGYIRAAKRGCSICGSDRIKLLGLGTEKLDELIRSLFPNARVDRMDKDTTENKDNILGILKKLRNHETDILMGTQMVAKGHDFPKITLVGIICADMTLNYPDFRAGERTFQLLSQVAGRAGRGETLGRVILQTFNPNHYTILKAKDQDFVSFYEHEIGIRKALNYPPFSRLVQILISGKEPTETEQGAKLFGRFCQAVKQNSFTFTNTIEILGPIVAPVAKIATQYRWQIMIKGRDSKTIHSFLSSILFDPNSPAKILRNKVSIFADVDL